MKFKNSNPPIDNYLRFFQRCSAIKSHINEMYACQNALFLMNWKKCIKVQIKFVQANSDLAKKMFNETWSVSAYKKPWNTIQMGILVLTEVVLSSSVFEFVCIFFQEKTFIISLFPFLFVLTSQQWISNKLQLHILVIHQIKGDQWSD